MVVSAITNLTVEGFKKLLDGTKVKCLSNVLAAKLKVAGFDTYVNTKSCTAVSSTTKKTINEIACEVIQGLCGNGQDCMNRLKATGYNPIEV